MSAQSIKFLLNSTMALVATVTDRDEKPVNGATVTVTIVHAFGSLKDTDLDCSEMNTPITWPITMSGIGDGQYEYIFASDLPIVDKERYRAQTNVAVGATERYAEPYIEAIVDRD